MKELVIVMKKYIQNNKGMTLVEILATLVLLGIVFIGIMGVFSQMSLFNSKTSTKLDTMNLAQQEVSIIKSKSLSNPVNLGSVKNFYQGEGYTYKETINQSSNKIYIFEKTSAKYTYELLLYENPTLTGDQNVDSLHTIHLKVNIDGSLNSETYGYVKAK